MNVLRLVVAMFLMVGISSIQGKDIIKKEITIKDKTFVPFIAKSQISKRVKELAQQINKDYAKKNPVIICVLNGAVFFFTDLAREITVDCTLDFLKISSYGNKMKSSGRVKLQKDVATDLTNRHVIIVEDIIDSGKSMIFLRDFILNKKPASVKIASFLFKMETAKISFPIDYIGFSIPKAFVVGYGLDFAQQGRNLSSIYQLKTADKPLEVNA